MTTLFSPITKFAIPTIGILSGLASILNKYRAAKVRKVRVAKHAKLLTDLDTHMLSDNGMKGFNCLTNEEQKSLLLTSIRL